MDLTREEEAILNGEEGEGKQKAMELVTALGKIYGADDLIDITSAHLSGAWRPEAPRSASRRP